MLNSSSNLTSSNGMFILHFIKWDDSRYLEISDNSKNPSSVNANVWIANSRDPIVNDDSAVLTLETNGTLKIMRQGGNSLVLYNSTTQPTKNTTVAATLSDYGNFILKESESDGSTKRVLWESFDHPTDTLLPGMKLGVSHKTGKNWSLTSWLTYDIPTPGPFTLEWERELIIRWRGVIYWKSGQSFENISPAGGYNFTIVSTGDEEYFTYNITQTNQSLLSDWVLTDMGQLQDFKRQSIAQTDGCYGYNTNGGCQTWKQPECRQRGDIFNSKSGFFIHRDDPTMVSSNTSLAISDCRATCWSNCSCVAFTSAFQNGTGCKIWTEVSGFTQGQSTGQQTVFILSSNPSHDGRTIPTKKKLNTGTKILIWIFCSIGIAGIPFLCHSIRRKVVLKGDELTKIENESLMVSLAGRSSDVINHLQNDGKNVHNLNVFSYACIMASTNNLENKLGEGGFGPVYKGKLPNGRDIAVKRLSRSSRQGIQEFKNELILISELQHKNLVNLLGCCIHGEERMLIYEYMSNKSLDYFLFDSARSNLLDWNKRFKIIEGISQGLLYLHKYSRVRIIHRDLKPSNILLDEMMNPKISDFGIARIFEANELEANTNRVVGTYGYMSPEYAMEGVFSIKSDVYSFGVLMLEILSGRKINRSYHDDHPINLLRYAWDLWQDGKGLELMDPAISDFKHQMLRCIHVALLCVEDNVVDRPTMSDVLSMITNESMPLPVPKTPTFSIRKKVEENLLDKQPKVYSVNGLSISDIDAR